MSAMDEKVIGGVRFTDHYKAMIIACIIAITCSVSCCWERVGGHPRQGDVLFPQSEFLDQVCGHAEDWVNVL